MTIDGKTELFGIIGNPVSHSLSPVMHNRAFALLNYNGVYLPFPVEDVTAALVGMRGLNIRGVSVTVPHKEAVIPHLDRVDELASKIGAVNTIIRRQIDGEVQLIGYNTDWLGAIRPLQEARALQGADVVILGAGGSARAIGFGLIEEGAQITLCSRTETRGRRLAEDLGCQWVSLEQVAALRGDVLINATSVGMVPHEGSSPVADSVVKAYDLVMDIVYAPLQTKLLRDAEIAGCSTINGLEMLLYQGVAQFELWTGKTAPIAEMRQALLHHVG